MRAIRYFLFILLPVVLLFIACDDFLEPEPDGRRTEDIVFKEYTYALGYFANLYSELPTGFHGVGEAMEAAMTDEAEHSDQQSVIQMYNDGSWDHLYFPHQELYAKYYRALYKLSVFLDNIEEARFVDPNTFNRSPDVNDQYRSRFYTETYFLRAFYYFELIKHFGGVPIVPEERQTIDDELDIPRSSFEECVQYIVENCEFAAENLPVRDTNSDRIGHATAAAAMALKSRVLLYAASPLHNPGNDLSKWRRAATAAADVLALPGYGLLTGGVIETGQMLPVWTNIYNMEVLFAIQSFNNNNPEYLNYPVGFSGGRGLTNPTQNLVDAFEMMNGVPISESSEYDSQNPYQNRDPRLNYFIGLNGATYSGRPIETFIGGMDGIYRDQFATKTGYYLKKFINRNANLVENTGAVRRHWVHFRYAEMLLNYAEAMNEAYGPEGLGDGHSTTALEAVNLVRERVSMPPITMPVNKEQLRERIHNERRVELSFEGHRAWDVRRWKKGHFFNQPIYGMEISKDEAENFIYEVIQVENRAFDESKMYLFPIPHQEVLKSEVVVQNPNW